MKKRTYDVLEHTTPGDFLTEVYSVFLVSLISANIIVLIIGTIESVAAKAPLFFNLFEVISLAIFLVEYIARLWACTADSKYASPIWGRVRFGFTPLVLIDLVAILPSIIILLASLVLGIQSLDFAFLRAARLLARAARLSRYSEGARALGHVLDNKKEELVTVVAVLMIMLLMASSLMYYAERDAQPDKFASIPSSMWWSIITLTTVGYGDVFPVTLPGRVIAGGIAIIGIGFFALPAGILGSGFLDEINQRRQAASRICPHCGEPINE